MSRSRRRPYSAVTGYSSAKEDKRHAARGVRRRQNQYTHNVLIGNTDWDKTPMPVRYECSFNETYCWRRDGKQSLQRLDHKDLNPYHCTSYISAVEDEDFFRSHEESVARQVQWIEKIQRK